MRLLNVETLKFELFEDDTDIPEYAILSHTWGKNEITYKDMIEDPVRSKRKRGYQKLLNCRKQAKLDGHQYFWMDTCCIDKSSSAELSEAINSMFHWYKEATVCYTFLQDVPAKPVEGQGDQKEWEELFGGSRWFTRGWTLQELIAPGHLVFYSKTWTEIGTKLELVDLIQRYTGIPNNALLYQDFFSSSIAQKMCWASKRSTTRTEDLAYCLMGLFNIHMPMLYGEGKQAFLRLQEEIMKTSDDLSLFCWSLPNKSYSEHRGLLAPSPNAFADSGNIHAIQVEKQDEHRMTNRGIKLTLPLIASPTKSFEWLGLLEERTDPAVVKTVYGIYLKKMRNGQYARVEPHHLFTCSIQQRPPNLDASGNIYVRQTVDQPDLFDHTRVGSFYIRKFPKGMTLVSVSPREEWDLKKWGFSFQSSKESPNRPKACISLKKTDNPDVMLELEVQNYSEYKRGPWFSINGWSETLAGKSVMRYQNTQYPEFSIFGYPMIYEHQLVVTLGIHENYSP